MALGGETGLPVIQRWNATFYRDSDKKWLKGNLVLSHWSLSFQELPSEKTYLTVDLESITDIKLERAWMGYKSLVVMVGSRKFWFSSFTSSHWVRTVIQHFIKETLFVRRNTHEVIPSGGREGSSALGRELLSIAHDSEKTLSVAASQLVSQGEQLDDAFRTMDLIHRDVGLGRQNIAYLESWVGRWHVCLDDLQSQASTQKANQNQTFSETEKFAVLYKLKKSEEKSGSLVISSDGIAVRNEERTVLQLTYREISIVNVSTPWTMLITRRMMGTQDITCEVTSAKLISILKMLGSKVKEKIEYDEPDNVDFICQDASRERVVNKRDPSFIHDSGEPRDGPQDRVRRSDEQQQSQISDTADIVTENEAVELCNVLRDVKSMALGISNELDVQNEKILQLTDDVVSVTDDVGSSNKRMQKLL